MMERTRRNVNRSIIYVFVLFIAAITFFPLFIMAISATHDNFNIVTQINLLPGNHFFINLERLTRFMNIPRGLLNSLFIAASTTIVSNYFSLAAGYGFSKFRFDGHKVLFTIVIIAMMLPGQLGILGFYRLILRMGLLNSYIPLIIPAIANSFAVFFYKQFLDGGLPNEMIESAIMDGSKEYKTFHRIVIPMAIPAVVTQGILVFIGSWNAYLMPLILLNDRERMTLPLMIATVRAQNVADFGAQYVGMLISLIPIIVLFAFTSKIIMEKVSISAAVKG